MDSLGKVPETGTGNGKKLDVNENFEKNKKVLPLKLLKNKNNSIIGGKASNLVALTAAGFPVPDGIVIEVKANEDFLIANGIKDRITSLIKSSDLRDENSLSMASSKIKELIIKGDLDKILIKDILDEASKIDKDTLWAVRSSAVAEDTFEASFAGQQDTYLNIKTEALPEYIKKCWASYWNDRALAYRHNSGISLEESGIAVIIQKMVDARISGVMFTADPVSNDDDKIMIESSWGLGESIVSGIVSPDKFVLDKKGKKIIEKKVNKKTKGIFLSMDGKVADIESSRQLLPSLSESEILRLAEIAISIEKYYGIPQDIEWAISGNDVYILQSRPITTLEKKNEILWTRAYGDEYWADITSPLFYSLLGEWLSKYVLGEGNQIMGYYELRDKPLLKLHKGHIYFNSEVLEIVFTFNPKFSRTSELLNYFPEKDQGRIKNAPTKIFRRLWSEVRIAILDNDGMITKTDKAYKKWAEGFLKEIKRFDSLDLKKLSDRELYDEYARMVGAFIKHYRLIRYGMVTHSIGTNLMVKRWLTDWLGDTTGQMYSNLISGLPGNKTIETNIAIEKLSSSIRKNERALNVLMNGTPEDFIKAINEKAELSDILKKYNEFMEGYGQRSHTRELYFPRWADEPALIIDMLKALSSSPEINMDMLEKEKFLKRQNAEKEVFNKISGLKYGFIKKPLFKTVLKFAQTYLIFRENQRFYLDHILYRQRRIFMEYGRRFHERGWLETVDDIFFLSKEEIFAMPDNLENLKGMIKERRSEFNEYKDILPPKFLKGKTEFDDTIIKSENVFKIMGTSASPGIATGKVRVVESIKELTEVKEGEILITSNTDPGWTPVFSRLGGLITETGGILSHGAVVSREYGIPAVTAVKNARKIFKTGQNITVDGNQGVIFIMEE